MRNLRRFAVTVLAALVIPVMGCKKKIVDTTTTEDSIEVTEGTQDTEPTSGEFDPADGETQDTDGAGGEDPSGAGGESPGGAGGKDPISGGGEDQMGAAPDVGSDFEAVLERLARLERGQRHAHAAWHQAEQALTPAGLLPGARPELDQDTTARAREAQQQLLAAQKGLEGLPNGEELGGMLDLMSLAVTQLSGVPGPCPEGENAEWFESQQQQIDDARKYVLGPPGSPDPKLMLALLDSAQDELDEAKTGACASE